MMKRNQILTLILLTITPMLFAQNKSYTLKAKIGNLGAPAVAYLMYHVNGEMVTDSAFVNNGNFEFKGSINEPSEAFITINHDGKREDPTLRPKYDIVVFMLENQTINFTTKDSICNAIITGSVLNTENAYVTGLIKPLIIKYNALDTEYKSQSKEKQADNDYIKDLEARATAINKEIVNVRLGFIDSHPASYLSLMLLNTTVKKEFDAIAMEKVYNKLSDEIKNTPLAKTVYKRIMQVKVTQIGVVATDFTQSDVNGKPVKLSDFRGKYVLVDFWASWCAPCRRENPNVRAAYQKYKGKGFEVLGVSLDKADAKTAWLKAIADDQLTWTQVSDLNGWNNEVAKLYGVKAIPTNFLIDPQGRIVAKDLRGSELTDFLATQFKDNQNPEKQK